MRLTFSRFSLNILIIYDLLRFYAFCCFFCQGYATGWIDGLIETPLPYYTHLPDQELDPNSTRIFAQSGNLLQNAKPLSKAPNTNENKT